MTRHDYQQMSTGYQVPATYRYCQWCEKDAHLEVNDCPETLDGAHKVIVSREVTK